MARIKKYISQDGTLRIAAVISTELADEAFRHLDASPLAKTLMSRALTGAVLMASQMKEGLSLGLHFVGEGPIGSIFTEARYEGQAKVYAENRNAALAEGDSELGHGLGPGRLDVIRSLPFSKEPHRGTVQLLTGEIGDDIAYYLQQSQQIPCIVALSAIPKQEGMELAGGYILELMPGYSDEIVTKLERLQPLVGSVTKKLQEGCAVEDLIDIYLDHFDLRPMEHPYDLQYECGCSLDRVERSLMLLGPTLLDQMIEDAEEAAIRCEFCGKSYQVSTAELRILRANLSQSLH